MNNLLNRIDNRLVIIEQEVSNRNAITRVVARVKKGKSKLKKSLEAGEIRFSDIIRAIKTNRCLRTPDRDFGATYLEQVLGTAIRETIPVDQINQVREVFGMKKLPPSELNKHKKVMQQQASSQRP